MNKIIKRSGFTLIELLVVIAIIGILAAVVLSNLNDARNNAKDSSIKSSLTSIRNQAELYYNNNNYTYFVSNSDDVCSNAEVSALLTAADNDNGSGGTDCDANASAYAAQAQLNNGSYFCVDSTGTAKVSATAKGASATVCP